MQINLETDYAVRIVDCLAREGGRLDAGEISARTGVTTGFSLKILRKLAGAEIVKSFRGAKGGYVLARHPEEITLKEVIEVIGGPIAIAKCQCEGYVCDHPGDSACAFHHVFREITQELSDRLEGVTFASFPQADASGETGEQSF